MSQNSNTPELRRTVNPVTRFPGTTPHSPISLSDSEPEPDFDIDVEDPTHIFEPLFSAFPEDYHHHYDVTFQGADLASYFRPGQFSPPRSRLFNEGGSEVNLELGLGLGFALGSSSQSNYEETRRFEGLRVVNLDTDSESDDGNLPDYDFDNNNNNNNNNNNQGFGGVSDFDRPPFCWDYLGFNNRNVTEENNVEIDDDFLYNGDNGGDEGDNVDAGVSTLFDAYQEREEQRDIVIELDDDLIEEDAVLELDWDTHFTLNSFYTEVYDMDFTVDMYEAILGEIEEGMNDWSGSPPASNAVIESLPAIKLLKDGGLKENEVVCAICRDDVSEEEVVRQLPCLHYYHGDCILPWLQIRNTCPICRYELPTDDAEYELRKRERDGENVDAIVDDELSLDSQVPCFWPEGHSVSENVQHATCNMQPKWSVEVR